MRILVFLVVVHSVVCQTTPAIDKLWSCPREPLTCLAGKPIETCSSDDSCPPGGQCCYRGCIKTCMFPRPCDRVVCGEGYSCKEEETVCPNPPCALQANCIPEKKVRCPALKCPSKYCPPGFKRATNPKGCDVCNCVPKKSCGPTCDIFCAYGNVMVDGCPTCKCNPEPQHPCSQLTCPSGQECRLIHEECTSYPCFPRSQCVPKVSVSYDNTCGLMDPTTAGYPVLRTDRQGELSCLKSRCPDNTICAGMKQGVNRCCWQYSQARVSPIPKPGECPMAFMIDFSLSYKKCEIDADCEAKERCCYQNKTPGMTRFIGRCMNPVHVQLKEDPNLCKRNTYITFMMRLYNFCT
ncbi:probable spore coat protein DDB_G0283555 [Aplysia californica]|uniref:Probable spore coat protein DDB_G0283555 n=1 Tax=Aplysia californica TaxID=6500 RepID=A0ABM0JRR0_APLCA|nr:probable spore coat protein DDB_G0283555 [Aplysia californica]